MPVCVCVCVGLWFWEENVCYHASEFPNNLHGANSSTEYSPCSQVQRQYSASQWKQIFNIRPPFAWARIQEYETHQISIWNLQLQQKTKKQKENLRGMTHPDSAWNMSCFASTHPTQQEKNLPELMRQRNVMRMLEYQEFLSLQSCVSAWKKRRSAVFLLRIFLPQTLNGWYIYIHLDNCSGLCR